jgi:hypothetical protein
MKKNIKEVPFDVEKLLRRVTDYAQGKARVAMGTHLHKKSKETLAKILSECPVKEALIKSHRGRCGKNGPRARRLGTSIPAVGCKCQANTAPGLLSPQPEGLKPFVDFCSVARSGETAAGIAQHSRLQKSANALQRPSWDLISASLRDGLLPETRNQI